MSSFNYTEILPIAQNSPEFRLVTNEGITTTTVGERTFLNIDDSVLEKSPMRQSMTFPTIYGQAI
jgi:hypothetical protein